MYVQMKKSIIYLLTLGSLIHCNQKNQSTTEPITPQAVYSKNDPGNWAGKEDEHTPVINVLSDDGNNNIQVTVTLKEPKPGHFIEKIFIADKNGKPYAEAIYNNTGNKSVFVEQVATLPSEAAKVQGSVLNSGSDKTWKAVFTMPLNSQTKSEYAVYARCSQHDLWKAEW